MKDNNISVNMFLNIKDIQNRFLYTTDGYVLTYLKIYPKNCKLMSKDEQRQHASKITSEFLSELKAFKIYFINRPVDVNSLSEHQYCLIEKTTDNQRLKLLDDRIKAFNELSSSGKTIENEIYFIIYEKESEYVEDELNKRIHEIALKFNNANYTTDYLTEKEIIQLCNSFNNPDTAYIEDQNFLDNIMRLE